MNKNNLSWRSARNVCIVKTLAKLGHYPTRTTEKEAWFLSPLRSETQASFNVSLLKNLWYDFGTGRGGNTIDLLMAIKKCSPYEALLYLEKNLSFSFSPPDLSSGERAEPLEVIRTGTITHPALVQYLQHRKIPLQLARAYCKEIWYRLKKKEYFALGLPNRLQGWELRNKFFKNSTSPKSYSFISGSSSVLLITEGMFDFLSLVVLEEKLVQTSDSLVLNSLSFINDVLPLLSTYKEIRLFLDNDPAGIEAGNRLLSLFDNITDHRDFYKHHTDLNEKLKNEKD